VDGLIHKTAEIIYSPSWQSLSSLSRHQLYVSFADFCKKSNYVEEAVYFYKNALMLHPYSSQTWIEYAKMQEEIGRYCTFK
jgi:two-component SAPR family response regulator